jgi:hypothetical protein
MAKNVSFKQIVATVSVISILSMAITFSLYKGFNEFIDKLVLEALDFLAYFGFNLNVQEFWIVLAGLLIFVFIVLALSGDK